MGSSGSQTVGYRYRAGVHFVMCHGVVDRFLGWYVDDEVAWAGDTPGGRVTVDEEELFGGESREGGISGEVDFENGAPDQPRNDYLESLRGADVSANRGLASAILRKVYLGNSPYMKPHRFRLQRILRKLDGSSQWNAGRAAIPAGASEPGSLTTQALAMTAPIGGLPGPANPLIDRRWYSDQFTSNSVAEVGGLDGYRIDLASSVFVSGRVRVPIDLAAAGIPEGYSNLEARVTFDVRQPSPGAALAGKVIFLDADESGAAFDMNESRGGTSWSARDSGWRAVPDGNSRLTFHVEGGPTVAIRDFRISLRASISVSVNDMNPAHIVRECLTDPEFGLGEAEADMGDSFTPAAETFHGEGFGLSLKWEDDSQVTEDFITDVLAHCDTYLYVDRRTGKWEIQPVRGNYDVASLPVITDADIVQINRVDRRNPADGVNSVTVKFYDRENAATSSVTVQDIALIQEAGRVNSQSFEYMGITNEDLANRVALRELTALSAPLATGSIACTRAADQLNPGQPFILNSARLGMVDEVCIVASVEEGGSDDSRITIAFSSDVFALPDVALTGSSEVFVEPDPDLSMPRRYVEEATYWQIVQVAGHTQTDALLSEDESSGVLSAAAGQPAGTTFNAEVFANASGDFDSLGVVDFVPSATITDALTASPSPVTVSYTSGTDLEDLSSGALAVIDGEFVRLDSITDTQMTFARGCFDTPPVEHAVNSAVLFVGSDAVVESAEFVGGESFSVRLRPNDSSASTSIDALPNNDVDFDSRAFRPLPVGAFQVDGSYEPPFNATESDVVLTWAHRSRVDQTGQTFHDFTAGNIGPEIGVSYDVEIAYEDSGTGDVAEIANTIDVAQATTYTLTSADFPAPSGSSFAARIRIRANRDGVRDRAFYEYRVQIPGQSSGYGSAWGTSWGT